MNLELQIFAKVPTPGEVKTRLIPLLGAARAAQLQQRMTQQMVEEAQASGLGSVVLYATPTLDHDSFQPLPLDGRYLQQGKDLGVRMATAIAQGLQRADAVLLMGADCPSLDRTVLHDVAQALQQQEVVFVPAEDGGYVLVAMRRLIPELFEGIAWGSSAVMAESSEVLNRLGVGWSQLPTLRDIDRPEDVITLPKEWWSE